MHREQRKLEEILRGGGLLAKVVDAYDPRPQQLAMGTRVLEALFNEWMLVVEAPTGVGKTMAYLVPAALYARAFREPVVISSYTRNLQDQILNHEAPRLRRLVHPDLKIAVLKGRANYLCRRRWDLFVEEKGTGPDGRWAVEKLQAWVNATESGAFSEAPDLGPRGAGIWGQIGGDARFCRGRLCRPDTGCFHKKARRDAREAHLVVVNHSLLLADMLSGGVLPDHRVVIIDEAHQLPDAALDPLTAVVSRRSFEEQLLRLGGSGEPGMSDRLRRVLRAVPSQVTRRNLLGRVRDFEKEARAALEQARGYFRALETTAGFPPAGQRRRYDRRAADEGLLSPEGEMMLQTVQRIVQEGRRLHGAVAKVLTTPDPAPEVTDVLEAAGVSLEEVEEEVHTLARLLAPEGREHVYVLEASKTRGPQLSSIPLETGGALREHLLDTHAAVVLTSATLAAGDDFSYFERQVGLERGEAVELQLESPFDLDRQLLTLVASHGVDPREGGYEAFLSQTIARLLATVHRKTLVLFTSHRTLLDVWQDLQARSELAGLEILAQRRDTPRAPLIERFRAAGRAVLLGTASFWQGVDFPGRDLEMLILTRLPFQVPTDPRVEALTERWTEEGQASYFQQVALPDAVLRVRQGVGRLIRRRGDRGVCVVLDPRMMRARYAPVFCRALPSAPQAVSDGRELLERVRSWFAPADAAGESQQRPAGPGETVRRESPPTELPGDDVPPVA